MATCKMYDAPKLVSRVETGHIIEAIPGAMITAAGWVGIPSMSSPSNVFGYVQGMRNPNTFDSTRQYSERVAVSLLVPPEPPFSIELLENYIPKETKIYQVVGEIAADGADTEQPNNNELLPGHLILTKRAKELVRIQLQAYLDQRTDVQYVFRANDGIEYPLDQLILSARPKRA